MCPASASADSGTKSCKDPGTAGSKPKYSEADTDDLTTASDKKKLAPGSASFNTLKHCRQQLIDVRNSAIFKLFQKRKGLKTFIFFFCFIPEFLATDIEKSVISERGTEPQTLVCTRLEINSDHIRPSMLP
jgi:hypothetical protein